MHERVVVLPVPLEADRAADAASASRGTLWRRGIALVVVFWWVATGLIIAMQRSGATRSAAVLLATGLALLGWHEMRATRAELTPPAVRRSFLGGALLWGWISVLFYGGVLTGIAPQGALPAAPAWALVPSAIAATLWSDLASIALIGLAAWGTRGAANRTGAWALALFWAVQQVAKLNVFFGVENPAANFLPPHLAHLARFFGPPENSVFLAVSIAVVSVAACWVGWRACTGGSSGARQAQVLHATILALAVLEFLVLGVALDTTPWDSFLKVRGT